MTSAPRRLVVLRHGQTPFNAQGRVQGQLDVPLDEAGREQATTAASLLAGEMAVVVSSDLSRARETAQLVADASRAPLELDPRLRELDLGAWQGLTVVEIRQRWPAEYDAWRAGSDLHRGGGETYAEGADRAAGAVDEALGSVPQGGTLVAVTHGGTARALLGRLLGLSTETGWALGPLGNAHWSVLVEAERGWRLERHNVGPDPGLGPVAGARDLGVAPGRQPIPVK